MTMKYMTSRMGQMATSALGRIPTLLAVAFLSISQMGLATTAHANFLDGIRDAITGHATDIKDRILHEDEHVEGMTMLTAEFRMDDVGRDAIHWANGSVSVVWGDDGEFYLQLEDDFEAGLAPDLYVYAAKDKVVDEGTFWATETYEIGKLKSSKGASYYNVSDLPEDVPHIVIWCKRFGAFIAAAEFTVN